MQDVFTEAVAQRVRDATMPALYLEVLGAAIEEAGDDDALALDVADEAYARMLEMQQEEQADDLETSGAGAAPEPESELSRPYARQGARRYSRDGISRVAEALAEKLGGHVVAHDTVMYPVDAEGGYRRVQVHDTGEALTLVARMEPVAPPHREAAPRQYARPRAGIASGASVVAPEPPASQEARIEAVITKLMRGMMSQMQQAAPPGQAVGTRKTVKRDDSGRILEVIETPLPAGGTDFTPA